MDWQRQVSNLERDAAGRVNVGSEFILAVYYGA
jgi:hypothetical protein